MRARRCRGAPQNPCTGRFRTATSGYRYYNPSTGRWLSRDPIEEDGGTNPYELVGNNPTAKIDYLRLAPEDWQLHLSDHGGAHIQNIATGQRWDATTLEPLTFKGATPPSLTRGELEEIRKAGVFDRILKNVRGSIVEQAANELSQEMTRRGTKCLTKRAARELAKRILQRIPVVTLIFVASDYAEGGVDKAVKNAVIPGELIEQVADAGKRKYDAWLDQKEKNFRACICRKEGLDPEDLE